MSDLGDFFSEVTAAEQQAVAQSSPSSSSSTLASSRGSDSTSGGGSSTIGGKRGRDDANVDADGDAPAESGHKHKQPKAVPAVDPAAAPVPPPALTGPAPPPPPRLAAPVASTAMAASGSITAGASVAKKVLPHHLQLVSDTASAPPPPPLPVHSSSSSSSSSSQYPHPDTTTTAGSGPGPWQPVRAAGSGSGSGDGGAAPAKKKLPLREAAGTKWVDPTLQDWPENDYRIFVGDLDPETTRETLAACFSHYPSFAMAKIIKQKTGPKAGKGKGFGFVSFLDPMECAKVIRTEQGRLCGGRPMKITKSTWKDRDSGEVRKKAAKKQKMLASLGLA